MVEKNSYEMMNWLTGQIIANKKHTHSLCAENVKWMAGLMETLFSIHNMQFCVNNSEQK